MNRGGDGVAVAVSEKILPHPPINLGASFLLPVVLIVTKTTTTALFDRPAALPGAFPAD